MTRKHKRLRVVISNMDQSKFRIKIEDLAWQIILLAISGVLSATFLAQPSLRDYLFLVFIGLFLITLLGFIRLREQMPYYRRFKNEEEAAPYLCKWLDSLPDLSEVKVVGVATTSVFWFFQHYSNLLERGGTLHVMMLDPKATPIITMLSNNEPDFHKNVVSKLATEGLKEIKPIIDEKVYAKVKDLLTKADTTKDDMERYAFVIKSCSLLWLHVRDKALLYMEASDKPQISRLSLMFYNDQPWLKVWMSVVPSICFRGDYIYQPRVGRDNPIVLLDGKRRKQDSQVNREIVDRIEMLRHRRETVAITIEQEILDR